MSESDGVTRYTHGRVCPICRGSADDPRGEGVRCSGYISSDGDYFHCSRKEHAGLIMMSPKSKTFGHRRVGPCRCGESHGVDHGNGPTRHQKPARKKLGVEDQVYKYRDAKGDDVFEVVRFRDPKDFRQRLPHQSGVKDVWSVKGVELVPYQLDMWLNAPISVPIWIVEGEKDADRLFDDAKLLATCNAMGAGKWLDSYSQRLNGRICYILADNDKAGVDHARSVARSLQKEAASVKIVAFPGLAEHGDVSDWLDGGGTIEQLIQLAAEADELLGADLGEEPKKEAEEKAGSPRVAIEPCFDRIMKLAEEIDLWRTPSGEAYVSLPVEGHRKHVPASSPDVERWIRFRWYDQYGGAPPSEALASCCILIWMKAERSKQEHKTWIRVADATPPGTDDFAFYLDLNDDDRHVVRITAEGWEVIADPPAVKLLRPVGMEKLPMPERSGSIDELWEFCNVAEDERMLLLGTLTAFMRPFGPYPLMVLSGEQGSAKSTTARVLKRLIDPRKPILGSLPDTPLDLWVVASSNWLLSFDNISSINRTMSNALCQLALEGGMERRKLHTDMDVVIMEAMRPMILNGIDDFARQPDLVDRVVMIECPVIHERYRRLERELWGGFRRKQPRILGALLDVMVGGLKALPSVHLDSMPRMAELATWGEAVGRHLGWKEGAFVAALFKNRDESALLALEDSHVASALFALGRRYPDGNQEWSGSVKELLDALREQLPHGDHLGSSWPRSPRGLSSHLRKIAPALRRAGVKVAFSGKTKQGRTIGVLWCAQAPPHKKPKDDHQGHQGYPEPGGDSGESSYDPGTQDVPFKPF